MAGKRWSSLKPTPKFGAMGLEVVPRRIHPGPEFYPATDAIDIPPVVFGHNTGAACSDWTPTGGGP